MQNSIQSSTQNSAQNANTIPYYSNPRQSIQALRDYLNTQVIGQPQLVERLLVALLCDGHLLVEGPPGLAKTRAIKALASAMDCDFQRVQFTPDMLPADLTGSDIYRPDEAKFQFQPGPLFHNLVLADEINRAPAKVQAALLEAMAERQISVGGTTYPLKKLFVVMATQNPIEHEGTYPLPEAQLDRFMLNVLVDYPDRATMRTIMTLTHSEALQADTPVVGFKPVKQQTIFVARKEILEIILSDAVADYVAALIDATHRPTAYGVTQLNEWIRYGASPRAAIAIERGARALAWLDGRDYVSPEDVQAITPDVLRHRLIPEYTAQARGVTSQICIDTLLNLVPAP